MTDQWINFKPAGIYLEGIKFLGKLRLAIAPYSYSYKIGRYAGFCAETLFLNSLHNSDKRNMYHIKNELQKWK